MNLSTSTAKSPDENLQEEIGKLLLHRMTPRPQIEPDTARPQFENDIERIMSAVARLTSSSIEGLENLTSELHEMQKSLKTEVARVQSEVDNAMAGIKIIMEAIAPLRSLRSGPAANISAPLHQAPPLTPSAESVEFEPGAADHQIPLEIHKLGLSDNQLEVIMRTAKPMAEEKCQEFLQRVAAILALRGQINDNDVSVAVHRALDDMIRNFGVRKE